MGKKILLYNGVPCIAYTIKDGKVILVPIEGLRLFSFDELNFLVLWKGGEEIDETPNLEDG